MTSKSGNDRPAPPKTWRYCSWHRAYDSTAVLVTIIEQGSGPGAGLHACTDCRTEHRLTPITAPQPTAETAP